MINVKKKPIELTKWKTEWSHLSDIEIPGILDSTELTIDIGENCSDALDILDKRVDTETQQCPSWIANTVWLVHNWQVRAKIIR